MQIRQRGLALRIAGGVALSVSLLTSLTPALGNEPPGQRVAFTTVRFSIVPENLVSVLAARSGGKSAEFVTVTYPRCLYRGRLTGKVRLQKIVINGPPLGTGDVLATGFMTVNGRPQAAIRRVDRAELRSLACRL